jgi:YrbI family 3-deoxy-D-manno-octulosonate 8-phosphate phosphatase
MIKLAVFDFDGVFTDGKIFFNENITKSYNIKDGMGINLLKKSGIEVIILSGFKENKSQKKISEHLDIVCYFDCKNKKKLLTEICELKKITFNEVSYMGDDVNDVEVLVEVNISGCPLDAVDDCKMICDFVSQKNGGEGCVREFCDYILFKKNSYSSELMSKIKKEFFYQINNFNIKEIEFLAEKIIDTSKNNTVYFSGIGKSGNMSLHLCSLLKSIGINCHFFDCTNLLHGDIGTIKEKDLVIFFSRSGNTKEIINFYSILKNRNCIIYGICCCQNSRFEKVFDKNFIIPHLKELDLSKINMIPNNSCMSQLLFSNILSYLVLNRSGLQLEDYHLNHPSGNIGENLKKIKDVIIRQYPKIIIDNNVDILNILLEMNKFNIGCCFFFNSEDNLIGILSDSDVRKLITQNKKVISKSDINTEFKFESDLEKYLMYCIKMRYVPILIENKLEGYIEFPPK